MKNASELLSAFEKLLEEANSSGCTENFLALISNKIKEEQTTIAVDDQIWYANTETNEIEKGIIINLVRRNNKLDSFSVNFVATDDCEIFPAWTLGDCVFKSRSMAESALVQRKSNVE